MKNFAALLITLAFAASTVLGDIVIGYPHDGDGFKRGESLKLRVETDSHWDVKNANLKIRIEERTEDCDDDWSGCYGNGKHGTVLYDGAFKPYYTPGRPELNYHDTFEIRIPKGFPKGSAVISVALNDDENYGQIDTEEVNIEVK
ncbi:hypothetical protein Moror_17632 [Moniliophthora roreri MCA 2997]|uniref:Uncharacterized protein n=1 Tax=Moniliophthora roreri (strain MCA 2997) TaxID=1381753 RepID=V2XE36_MONRO|nr:hypothetical protein Moror_17632 [Moniliophthora roreri MCA 2997]KAI3612496.1 hypothetical protein WG66_009994 [Moniliophthora roreri]